ncbi:alpha-hydroxy acid oxidase [Asaia astilbis]
MTVRYPLTSIEDLRLVAKQRLPKLFYDFVDSGSWTQSTYRANEQDFERILLRQRVGRDVRERLLQTHLLGQKASMPIVIAPTGGAGFLYPDAEIAAARAAASAGISYGLSVGSSCSLEAVRAASNADIWFQVSLFKDRLFLKRLIERARNAECGALILTLDYHVVGQRHCDLKNGVGFPPRITPRLLADVATHPRWILRMARARHRGFGNVIGHVEGVTDIKSFGRWQASQPFDLNLDWEALRVIRDAWPGKLLIKGILDPEDAEKALSIGADAISVSNQGGRQIDGGPSSIAMLPSIVDTIDGRAEVFLDGGIRTGQQILKAVCLGARGVLIGRAALYGLAAGGEAGMTQALSLLRKELDHSMAFCGIRALESSSRTNLSAFQSIQA